MHEFARDSSLVHGHPIATFDSVAACTASSRAAAPSAFPSLPKQGFEQLLDSRWHGRLVAIMTASGAVGLLLLCCLCCWWYCARGFRLQNPYARRNPWCVCCLQCTCCCHCCFHSKFSCCCAACSPAKDTNMHSLAIVSKKHDQWGVAQTSTGAGVTPPPCSSRRRRRRHLALRC